MSPKAKAGNAALRVTQIVKMALERHKDFLKAQIHLVLVANARSRREKSKGFITQNNYEED